MFWIGTVLLILFPIKPSNKIVSADCISFGHCGHNEAGYDANCVYDGPPRQLDDEAAIDTLRSICPWMFEGSSADKLPKFCCDKAQINTMRTLASIPELVVGRCPACWRNLRTFMCARACSTEMDQFELVSHTIPYVDENGQAKLKINATILAVNYNYMHAIMTSCEDVKFLGSSALIAICMTSECTPPLLLQALSNPDIGSPHHSELYLTNQDSLIVEGYKELKPLKMETYRCDQAILNPGELEPACQCSDCDETCLELELDISYIEKVGSITVTELLIIGLAITTVIALSCIAIHNVSQKRFSGENAEKDKVSNRYWNIQNRISTDLYTYISNGFFRLGIACSLHPYITILISILCCTILSVGMSHFEPTADPISLWGLEGGRCLREKEYFDNHFGPFYRTTQIIMVPKNQTAVEHNGKTIGPVFRQHLLLEAYDIQTAVQNVVAKEGKQSITLKDVCFAPLSPDINECTIQDVIQYFQNDRNKILDPSWMDHILHCIDSYYSEECLSVYLSPIFPYVAFAGLPGENEYTQATALSLVILNNNHLSGEKLEIAKKWETEFLRYMGNLKSDNFDIYYNAEKSAEDGINSISEGDIGTVIISYVVMFAYMSIFLSTFRGFRTVLVDIRISLGFCCIVMIAMSLTSSFGFFSFLGYKTSLVVLEVTPFLVLAVGCGDNFIFVKNFVSSFNIYDDTDSNGLLKQNHIETAIAMNLRQIGPSLVLSSCAQIVAFGIGAIVPVSSVRLFALYSAFAVFVKFCLQVIFFIAVFTLDTKRQYRNRFDILCCLGQRKLKKKMSLATDTSEQEPKKYEILFERIFRKLYTPYLMNKFVRPIIIVAFTAWFIASLALIPRIKIGLNLQVIFPSDSYTRKYLMAVEKYSAVGPPIYMVIKDGYRYEDIINQNKICGTVSCDPRSLINQLTQISDISDISYIETPPPSWLDDFFSWISSTVCCQLNRTSGRLCAPNVQSEDCVDCQTNDKPFQQRPLSNEFNWYLSEFLARNPDTVCLKAGKALFSSSVELFRYGHAMNETAIGATNFMAYSTVQRSVEDSYKSLQASRHISQMLTDYITKESNNSIESNDRINAVFFYSMVHVYYEQYIGIMQSTLLNLIYSILGVFIVTFILLGFDIQSSLTTLIILIFTTGQLMGSMYLAGIDLNAISIVNLIMSMGIAVEFYVHLIRDFSVTVAESLVERAKSIVNHIGVFIFIGITVPELVSIATMSTANSEMFRLYFFKMYLILIVTCTLNALVFLPAFLSYFGGPINRSKLDILRTQYQLNTVFDRVSGRTLSEVIEMKKTTNTEIL